MLRGDKDAGEELFGTEIDILAPQRVRLRIDGSEAYGLDPDRDYRFVVTYHNDDAEQLSSQRKSFLRHKYPNLSIPVVKLKSEPIPFRKSHE